MNDFTRTLLFVDDEIYIRQSFADYFEDNNWKTLQAESGEAALDVLETESPAGAIVDIRMGGMDGDLFIRKVLEKKMKMAFVICTGSPEYSIPEDLMALPCVSGFLFRKPVTDMAALERELLMVIENIQA